MSASREPRVGFGTSLDRRGRSKRRDVDAPELLDLQTADTRDEAQVIVARRTRSQCAHHAQTSHCWHRLGVSAIAAFSCQRGFEAALHEPVVGGEVGEPVRLRIEVVMRRDDVRLGRASRLGCAASSSE